MVFAGCWNPFAPTRGELEGAISLTLTEQKSPDEVLQNSVMPISTVTAWFIASFLIRVSSFFITIPMLEEQVDTIIGAEIRN